jgi:hypothetical protein
MVGRTDPRLAKREREPGSGAVDLADLCARPDADGYGRGTANERVVAVYVRVVRFTAVSAERIEGALSRIKESDGPPPGVSTTRLEMLFDASQGTADQQMKVGASSHAMPSRRRLPSSQTRRPGSPAATLALGRKRKSGA